MTHTSLEYKAGNLADKIDAALKDWQENDKVQRLWASDSKLWTGADEANWTGWLTIAESELSEVSRIEELAKELKSAGITDVVLLGMGGSSLCPAMMATTFGKMDGHPKLSVLDSTAPEQIKHMEESINLETSFFIVSSKSGSTLEPNIFKAYFFKRMQEVLGKDDVGEHFLAITDPGSHLEKLAHEDKFKGVFHGMPSIGGRYSALSNFGMVPSGLAGVDLNHFLGYAKDMAGSCASTAEVADNPGAMLGVILGVCATNGKDKVTLIASPGIHALGAWLEQLLAESTGKIGRGIIPVDQEPLGKSDVYGDDRVFAYIRLNDAPDAEQDRAVEELEKAGEVVVRLHCETKNHLSAELFRWEFATAVAGSIIGIDAFNQPDVEASKVRAKELTTEFEETGKISAPEPIVETDGITLFTDDINAGELKTRLMGDPSVETYIQAHLSRIAEGDYVDLAAFFEMSDKHLDALQESRKLIRDNKKVATCLGFGPRFLHSTGQAYKGGPNTGVFFQITADHPNDLDVPGHKYTFGLVIQAQAQSDFEVLVKRSRRALHVHLGSDIEGGLAKLHEIFKRALA
jgi:transaldolase/glucose-6-phosphate isomerase